jgi:hypothetical protein
VPLPLSYPYVCRTACGCTWCRPGSNVSSGALTYEIYFFHGISDVRIISGYPREGLNLDKRPTDVNVTAGTTRRCRRHASSDAPSGIPGFGTAAEGEVPENCHKAFTSERNPFVILSAFLVFSRRIDRRRDESFGRPNVKSRGGGVRVYHLRT